MATSRIATLETVISADESRLSATLKSASSNVVSFVKKMNAQEVNWKSIFAKTLSTSLISGIASVVAIAITKALALQTQLAQGARQMGEDFLDSQHSISDWALSTSKSTLATAEDQAKAFYIANKILRDDAQAREVARLAALESLKTNQDLTTVVMAFANILKSLGITTISDTIDTLNMLSWANSQSSMSWSEFMGLVEETAPKIKDIDFTDWITGIAALSRESGVTSEQVKSAFSDIADSIENPAEKLNILLGGFGSIKERINKEGVLSALSDISDKVKSSGMLAVEMAQAYGLNTQSILLLKNASDLTFPSAISQQKQIKESVESIEKSIRDNISATERWQAAWNALKSAITQATDIVDFLEILSGTFSSLEADIRETGTLMGGLGKYISENIGPALKVLVAGQSIPEVEEMREAFGESADVSQRLAQQLKLNEMLLEPLGQKGLQEFIRTGTSAGLSLFDLLQGVKGNMTSNFQNVFNITTPPGGEQLTSQRIVEQLKSQFYSQ